jgi:hypothetical protein
MAWKGRTFSNVRNAWIFKMARDPWIMRVEENEPKYWNHSPGTLIRKDNLNSISFLEILPKENRKKDRIRPLLPDAIRYLFYQDVLSHFGVPKQPPRHCFAWEHCQY